MRAMILAAGRGERMRPLTDTTPKPLLEARGKPLIVWHIERLVAAGIHDIIINHAWLGEQIERALGDGTQFGARLQYSPENPSLETAGGIAKALPFFDDAPFLVVNGDVWCDWDPAQATRLQSMMAHFGALGWLLLVNNPDHNPDGDFVLSSSSLAPALASKVAKAPHIFTSGTAVACVLSDASNQATKSAASSERDRALTFAGIGLYQPELFRSIVPGAVAPLAPLLRTAIKQNSLIGSHHIGEWVDVGTPERLRQLQLIAPSGNLVSQPGHATL